MNGRARERWPIIGRNPEQRLKPVAQLPNTRNEAVLRPEIREKW
jgi:hypothetical protein